MHSEILEIIMKTIFKKYDKHAIVALPRVIFEGEIKVIDHPEDVEAAIDFLLSQDILGIDTEMVPESMSMRRLMVFSVVVLPQPAGPISTTNCPSSMVKFRSLRMGVLP